MPDPDGPGRLDQIAQASAGISAALGPTGTLRELPESWALANTTLQAVDDGAVGAPGLVRAEDRLGELLLYENAALVERIGRRRLAAFDELTAKSRARMEDTALAYLRRQGNAAAMAESMDVHAQTARYRLARLRSCSAASSTIPSRASSSSCACVSVSGGGGLLSVSMDGHRSWTASRGSSRRSTASGMPASRAA